jgi:tRNA threonylcarbamoyladenosine biosynthesis protein TsaE
VTHNTLPDRRSCVFLAATETVVAASAARLAKTLLHRPAQPCIVTLHGDLGAGKTTWVRALLRALGERGRIKSPTYAIAESYQLGAWSVWHFDFYRFSDPNEWEEAGFRDTLAEPALHLIEWPERVEGLLPTPDIALHIALQHGQEDTRQLRFWAQTALGEALLAQAFGEAHP